MDGLRQGPPAHAYSHDWLSSVCRHVCAHVCACVNTHTFACLGTCLTQSLRGLGLAVVLGVIYYLSMYAPTCMPISMHAHMHARTHARIRTRMSAHTHAFHAARVPCRATPLRHPTPRRATPAHTALVHIYSRIFTWDGRHSERHGTARRCVRGVQAKRCHTTLRHTTHT